MKVYSRTGKVYEGEPVDCRELLASGSWLSSPPTDEEIAEAEAAAESASEEGVTVRKSADAKKPAAKKGSGK